MNLLGDPNDPRWFTERQEQRKRENDWYVSKRKRRLMQISRENELFVKGDRSLILEQLQKEIEILDSTIPTLPKITILGKVQSNQ